MFFSKRRRFSWSVIACFLCVTTLYADRLHVVSITEDFSSIAKAVGGDHIQTVSLTQGSINLHDVIARPSMALAVKKADVLIRLGMQQDSWVDGLITVAGNPSVFPGKKGYLDASVNIDKLEVPHGHIDGRHGDVHIHGNPHYWLNPRNGIIIAEDIKHTLIEIDPDHRDEYESNFIAFKQEMERHIDVWDARLSELSTVRFLTYHTAWSYFFDAFGMRSLGQLEPLPGIPPTVKHLAELKSAARRSTEPIMIIQASYYPTRAGQSLAEELHAQFYSLPTNVGSEGIETYPDLFEAIVEVLDSRD